MVCVREVYEVLIYGESVNLLPAINHELLTTNYLQKYG
jgi:hypothetical protein